jgi:hypothetical protein
MKWTYKTRSINGKRIKCKVHRKADGNELVRKIGYRNRKD